MGISELTDSCFCCQIPFFWGCNDLILLECTLQAAYTVGGHSFSATGIEYVILKMKPPVHRPQIVCTCYNYF